MARAVVGKVADFEENEPTKVQCELAGLLHRLAQQRV